MSLLGHKILHDALHKPGKYQIIEVSFEYHENNFLFLILFWNKYLKYYVETAEKVKLSTSSIFETF